MAPSLFVVATPIGNLEDVTLRALRVLKAVDAILAEDTRRTSKLLAHYAIRKPLVSVREHNEQRETPRAIARLARGESLALVTDAGTPGIADPGTRLVRAVREAGYLVVPIPGPSAVTAALSVAGFAADEFVFMGFPPPTGAARTDWMNRLTLEPRTVVFFEAPHRIKAALGHISELNPGRELIICREITKLHETITYIADSVHGKIELSAKGEFVVVVGPATEFVATGDLATSVVDMFGRLHKLAGLAESMSASLVAHTFSIQPSRVLNLVRKHNIMVKRQNGSSP